MNTENTSENIRENIIENTEKEREVNKPLFFYIISQSYY